MPSLSKATLESKAIHQRRKISFLYMLATKPLSLSLCSVMLWISLQRSSDYDTQTNHLKQVKEMSLIKDNKS